MRTRTTYLKELLKTSFWLTPSFTALALVALLPIAKALEGTSLAAVRVLESQTLEGARLVLSSIATAVMTVVGVLFSVTVVVLQQVSQQYSPRVIENFVRSLANQIVLGFYIGTFAYCVLLLGTIQEEAGGRSPTLAPALGIVLAMSCLVLLIYYVHHLVKSIKSTTILAGIARQAVGSIDSLLADLQETPPATSTPNQYAGQVLRSTTNGYLQEIDFQAFGRALGDGPWRARVVVIPGDYIHIHAALAEVYCADKAFDERRRKALLRAFTIDLVRTHTQDLRFGMRQMADVALRALSPGINDPSTAVEAVNEIGTVLLHYARAPRKAPVVGFKSGGWLELAEPSFQDLLDLCFNEIALAGRSFYLVQQTIQRVLRHCETSTEDPSRRTAIRSKYEQLTALADGAPGRHLFGALPA